MKIYISGKISDLPYEQAWMNFKTAEEHLIEDGYDVVNPMNNGLDPDEIWINHMKADIKIMMDCEGVYFLRNWQDSKGARIEHTLAIFFDYYVMYQK